MANLPDNPPAYPSRLDEPIPGGGSYRNDRPGMSLRDWFAGQALAGAMACESYDGSRFELIATHCFEAADAMLAERSK